MKRDNENIYYILLISKPFETSRKKGCMLSLQDEEILAEDDDVNYPPKKFIITKL